MAPLQKRALLTFLIGLAFALALSIIFILEGDVTAFNSNQTLRWIVYVALVGAPLSYLVLIDLTLRKPVQLDERDRHIMQKSGRIQWLAVMFTLAAWMIALTEVYQETRLLPVVFLALIFISTIIISVIAQSLGILIGYRSSR